MDSQKLIFNVLKVINISQWHDSNCYINMDSVELFVDEASPTTKHTWTKGASLIILK